MSGKKAQADLTALFRLEFYRKQNNWKFCSQVQKAKKASSKCKTKPPVQPSEPIVERNLNKTYNVETDLEPGCEERSDLNNAFVESDYDKNKATPQNSPTIHPDNWSPELIHVSDKWSPQDQTEGVPTDIPTSDTKTEIKFSKFGLYKPNLAQNWQYQTENRSPNVLQDPNPCLVTYDQKIHEEHLNIEKNYDENLPQQSDPDWLQHQMVTWRQKCINRINNPNEIEPQIVNQNCYNTAKLSKENHNNLNIDFSNVTPNKNIPDPVLENWQEWKETEIPLDNLQEWQANWQEEWQALWQNQYQELPEVDKNGYEGVEARWPVETQVWTNKVFPGGIWSHDVLRELEFLQDQEYNPEIKEFQPETQEFLPKIQEFQPEIREFQPKIREFQPKIQEFQPEIQEFIQDCKPVPGEKWVPPDRLLQWMLANKECCEDVLETSCESEEQFLRSAQCAPHSSEIDIQSNVEDVETTLDLACGNILTDSVYALSEAALLAAGRAHAKALRCVARELRNREQRHSTNVPAITETPYDGSCEEYPTRDIGLYQPTFIDTFISGSHKNNPNIKTLDKPKEKDLDVNIKFNEEIGGIVVDKVDRQIKVKKPTCLTQSDTNMGQIDMNMGQSNMNMVQSDMNMRQSNMNMGQSGINTRETHMNMRHIDMNMYHSDMNIRQNDIIMGENVVNRVQTDTKMFEGRMGQCSLVQRQPHMGQMVQQGQNEFKRDQMGKDQVDCCHNIGQPWGFGEIKGRGRGRSVIKETQVIPGRGRGRKDVTMSH